MSSTSKTISVSGFLTSVSDFKKLIFQVDEKLYTKVADAAISEHLDGKSPIKKSDTGKFYLSVSLNRFEKAKIQKYVKMERSNIDFTVSLNGYDFIDPETCDPVQGWSLILVSIKKITKVVKEETKILSPVAQKITSIEQQLADLSKE